MAGGGPAALPVAMLENGGFVAVVTEYWPYARGVLMALGREDGPLLPHEHT